MAFFPIMVDLCGKRVLIVGGGETAARKAAQLQDFGAEIIVVAKELKAAFPKEASIIVRSFQSSDIEDNDSDIFLVIAATDDREVNQEVSGLSKKYRIPVNVVDDEPLCSFTFPAVLRDRDVVVSVSSGGKSPLVTQYVKNKIGEALPEHIGEINDEMGKLRKRIRASVPGQKERKQIYKEELERFLKRDQK